MAEIEKIIRTINGDVITYSVIHHDASLNDPESESGNRVSRTAIILVHGLASNMTRWTEFVENTVLTANVDLLRLDLRGHGKSMSYKRISIQDWCVDIHQIMNRENYSSVILVGHSLGAKIAIHFADLYPECTKGIVLIDPVFPKAITGILNIARHFRYLVLILIYLLLFKVKIGFYKKELPYRDLYKLDIKTREILNGHSDANIAELYMNPFEDLIYIPFVNYCQDIFEVTRKIPNLSQIKCAVLCLLSRGATMSSIKITKSFINQFPSNEIEVIDADHWLLTEKPVESRHAIENWCSRRFKSR